jgi:hypothetical protein
MNKVNHLIIKEFNNIIETDSKLKWLILNLLL